MSRYEEIMSKLAELTQIIDTLEAKIPPVMVYNYVDQNMPEWARPTVSKLVQKGIIKGDENGLALTDADLRMLVWNDRAGCYGG